MINHAQSEFKVSNVEWWVGKLAVRVNNGESFLLILLSQWLETKGNWDASSKVGVKEANAALA